MWLTAVQLHTKLYSSKDCCPNHCLGFPQYNEEDDGGGTGKDGLVHLVDWTFSVAVTKKKKMLVESEI